MPPLSQASPDLLRQMLQMFINSLLSAQWTKQRNGYRHRDFDTRAGTVISSIGRRHRSIEFKKFLAKIDVKVPDELEVHLACDNHSTHKSPTITKWLQAHPGSTCTSHRPTRRGSTRSNDSLPTSPLIFSNAQTTAVFKRSKQTSAPSPASQVVSICQVCKWSRIRPSLIRRVSGKNESIAESAE